VDDEKVVRDFLCKLLSMENTQVTIAENGEEAIRRVSKEHFDIIFLDARMPGIDGIETFKELKKITGNSTKYVMMTGYSIDSLLEKLDDQKVEAFIRKPFDIQEIKNVLNDYEQQDYQEEIKDILIVTSQTHVLNLFKRLLKNYTITAAKDGQEALSSLNNNEFNLVFSDMVLNDMSGIELYAKIKNTKPKLNVILLMADTKKKGTLIESCLYKEMFRLFS
jgi:CheY-like chemotaxis protein